MQDRAQDRYILSGITWRESAVGKPVNISSDKIDSLLHSVVPPRDPQEVLDRVLLYIGAKADTFIATVVMLPDNNYPIGFARNAQEFEYCMQIGTDSGLIKADSNEIRLIAKGWQRYNALRDIQIDSSQAFVAMSFRPELESIWQKGFKPALEQAGYHPLRIDKKEFNDKIDDRIIAEIRRSGLLVADVTGQSAGVYFEAGFAVGLGLEVIWTCKKDQIQMAHFDTRQYKHILWQDAEHLKIQLVNRIEATGLAETRAEAGPVGT